MGPVVSEEKFFENVDDGRQTDDGGYHPISSPEARGSGELKALRLSLWLIQSLKEQCTSQPEQQIYQPY